LSLLLPLTVVRHRQEHSENFFALGHSRHPLNMALQYAAGKCGVSVKGIVNRILACGVIEDRFLVSAGVWAAAALHDRCLKAPYPLVSRRQHRVLRLGNRDWSLLLRGGHFGHRRLQRPARQQAHDAGHSAW
jgi:hypothetical protein